MSEPTTSTEPKTYRIGDKTYRQEPLAWTQEKWLAEHVFKGADLAALSELALLTVLQDKAPLMLAIILIEEGWTRAAKCRAGFAAVLELSAAIADELTPEAIREIARDFFSLNRFENLWLLVDFGKMAPAAAAPTPNGSMPASAVSPAETSPSATGSVTTADQLIASSTPAVK